MPTNMSIQGQTPNANNFKQFLVNASGAQSVVPWVLYDNLTYAAAGQSQLTFFQRAVGAAGVTLADTNMQVASALPAPQAFILRKIEFQFHSGASVGSFGAQVAPLYLEDVNAVLNSGYVNFTVGQGLYVQDSPLLQFPADNRLAVSGFATDATTAAAASQTLANYAAGAGLPRDDGPFGIPSSQNFAVTVNWPSLVPTVSTSAGILRCRLHGWLYRPVQG